MSRAMWALGLLGTCCVAAVAAEGPSRPIWVSETRGPVDGKDLVAFTVDPKALGRLLDAVGRGDFDRILTEAKRTFLRGALIEKADRGKLEPYKKRLVSADGGAEYRLYDKDGRRILLYVSGSSLVESLRATPGEHENGRGGLPVIQNYPTVDGVELALRIFHNHLTAREAAPADFEISVSRYGKAIRLIRLHDRTLAPPAIRGMYLMDRRGTVRQSSVAAARVAFASEYPVPGDVASRERFVADFIAFYGRVRPIGSTRIISSLDEIPGYAESPLDEDLEGIIAPVRRFSRRGKEVCVAYTYNQIGGLAERFRFEFTDRGCSNVQSIVLGEGIGQARYLE